jgi:hypothetical protein
MIDRFAPICLENHPLISLSEDISLSERMLFVDFLSFAHKGIPRTIPNALLNLTGSNPVWLYNLLQP